MPDAPTNITALAFPERIRITGNPVDGADSYNIYWKKNKIPNEYFSNDLNKWTIANGGTGTTCSIITNKLFMDLDSGSNNWIEAEYNFVNLSTDDYGVSVEISNYNWDDSDDGMYVALILRSDSSETDNIKIRYQRRTTAPSYRLEASKNIGGYISLGLTFVSVYPNKFKLERSGTVFTWYYDIGAGWVEWLSDDIGLDAANINKMGLRVFNNNQKGGSVCYDNLIITPSVMDSGTQITEADFPYDHEDLDAGERYVYEVTSVVDGVESSASLETYDTPTASVKSATYGMAGDLSTDVGDVLKDEGLESAVIMSLFTDRRARVDDDLPNEYYNRRGWWGDQALPVVEGDEIGSYLWLLERSKTTDTVMMRARQYVKEALQWMVDDNIIAKIAVDVERNHNLPNDGLFFRVRLFETYEDTYALLYEGNWGLQLI